VPGLADLFTKKKPSLLGIDISSSSVKVLELSKAGEHYRVERYAVEPLPQNAVVEHAITEVEQVGSSVERAVKRSGSKCKHAAVAVPSAHVITKIIKMPVYRTDSADDDFEKVKEALAAMSPWDMDYSRWIGMIAALKREFGDSARELAIAWAQGKPGEVEREWDRLKVDRAKQMSLGTIFYMARSA